MANTLATLNNKLATALRDTAYDTWGTAEMDDLLKWSVATLWPRFSRPLDPTTTTVTLVDGTEYYSLPAGVMNVSRCDLLNASNEYVGPVFGGAWEITGDVSAGTAKLHVSPQIPSSGGKLQLVGYGRYDTTTNYIPDDFIPLVLAKARAEAYRRIAADRQRFKNWLSRNQSQNVTVNELLLMINEADREAFRQEQHNRVWQKPCRGALDDRGIFSDDTTRLAITYNVLTLNNPADSAEDTYEVNSVTVTGSYDAITDPHEQRDGTEAYGAFKESLSIVIDGVVRSTSIAGLFDKVKALRAAFDASKISHENSTGSNPTLARFSISWAGFSIWASHP